MSLEITHVDEHGNVVAHYLPICENIRAGLGKLGGLTTDDARTILARLREEITASEAKARATSEDDFTGGVVFRTPIPYDATGLTWPPPRVETMTPERPKNRAQRRAKR